jgi:hypothetical protein
MIEGIDLVFDYLPKILERKKVCQECRDMSKCAECVFNADDKNRREVIEPNKP